LAEIVDAVLAQQRVHVRDGEPGAGQFLSSELAVGDQDPGRMVDQAGDPAVPTADRNSAMRDQEGDQRDRRGSERCVRCGRAPADDRADRDRDREVERAELCERAPFAQPQADYGYREEQDGLDGYPSQTACATDQLRHRHHRRHPRRTPGAFGARDVSCGFLPARGDGRRPRARARPI
jgi:hypothetical protein